MYFKEDWWDVNCHKFTHLFTDCRAKFMATDDLVRLKSLETSATNSQSSYSVRNIKSGHYNYQKCISIDRSQNG